MDEEMERLMTATRRLHRHQGEIAKLRELRDAEMARITEWFDDCVSGEASEVTRLEGEIEGWARAHRTEYDKSWTTPWAKIQTRSTKGATIVDNHERFHAWCVANDLVIPPKPPAPDVTALRAKAHLEDDGALVVDGEIVPGVHVEGANDVNVTIKVQP